MNPYPYIMLLAGLGLAACALFWMRRCRLIYLGGRRLIERANLREADANTRANLAEAACESLKDQMMRGATVATWRRPAPIPPGADPFYFHVRTTKGDILLTEEQLAVGLERATKLIRHV